MQSFEIFYKVRKAKGIGFLSDVFHKSEETIKKWCVNTERYGSTPVNNPLDHIKSMVDELRSDGEYSILSDLQDFLFPCGKLTVCGEPTEVILEFTTASQESFVSFIDAIKDGNITAEERKQILDCVGEVETAIEKIKAVLK